MDPLLFYILNLFYISNLCPALYRRQISSSPAFSKPTACFPGHAVMDAHVCQVGIVPVSYPSALRDPELFSVCIHKPECCLTALQISLGLDNSAANVLRVTKTSISSWIVNLYYSSLLAIISYTISCNFLSLRPITQKPFLNVFSTGLSIFIHRIFIHHSKMELENSAWCAKMQSNLIIIKIEFSIKIKQ